MFADVSFVILGAGREAMGKVGGSLEAEMGSPELYGAVE